LTVSACWLSDFPDHTQAVEKTGERDLGQMFMAGTATLSAERRNSSGVHERVSEISVRPARDPFWAPRTMHPFQGRLFRAMKHARNV